MYGRLTQKEVRELQKNVLLSVMSFDKETGKRGLHYSGLRPVEAFDHMLRQMKKGFKVLVFEYRGGEPVGDYISIEWNEKRRVTYEEMEQYQIDKLY